jgi:hypothetical protein
MDTTAAARMGLIASLRPDAYRAIDDTPPASRASAAGRTADVICARFVDTAGNMMDDDIVLSFVPDTYQVNASDPHASALTYHLEPGYHTIHIDPPAHTEHGHPITALYVRYRLTR